MRLTLWWETKWVENKAQLNHRVGTERALVSGWLIAAGPVFADKPCKIIHMLQYPNGLSSFFVRKQERHAMHYRWLRRFVLSLFSRARLHKKYILSICSSTRGVILDNGFGRLICNWWFTVVVGFIGGCKKENRELPTITWYYLWH